MKKDYTFKGTVSYVSKSGKKWKPDEPVKYSFSFYPENRSAVKETGVKNKIKEDKEGGLFYSFYNLSPLPVFVDSKPFDGWVGNGSEAEVTLEVETFTSAKHGPSARSVVKAINVTNLIEYSPEPTNEGGTPGASSAVSETPKKMPF